jgi:hypothetical protein
VLASGDGYLRKELVLSVLLSVRPFLLLLFLLLPVLSEAVPEPVDPEVPLEPLCPAAPDWPEPAPERVPVPVPLWPAPELPVPVPVCPQIGVDTVANAKAKMIAIFFIMFSLWLMGLRRACT